MNIIHAMEWRYWLVGIGFSTYSNVITIFIGPYRLIFDNRKEIHNVSR